MEVSTIFYNRDVFGIDPETLEVGYCIAKGLNSDEAKVIVKRKFIAQDWGHTETYIQMENVFNIVKLFMEEERMRTVTTERIHTKSAIHSANPYFMNIIAKPMVQDLHRRGFSFNQEQYDPGRKYLFGPLLDVDSTDSLKLLEGVGLWGLFIPSFRRGNLEPWVLYRQDGSLYTP